MQRDNSLEYLSDAKKLERNPRALDRNENLERFIERTSFWEEANKFNEDGKKIRNTPYYPEEELTFNENDRCVLFKMTGDTPKKYIRALQIPSLAISMFSLY